MTDPEPTRRQFASDNYAGICPQAWQALERANRGHAQSYGDDAWTLRAANLLRDTFETDCEVFFVFNGTAANALSLASMGQSYHSILCHEIAHVETDECGATEFFSNGMKVLQVDGEDGKVHPNGIEKRVRARTDIHYPKPRAVSLTQATEVGTVYSLDELRILTAEARRFGLRVQMDGARFANAVAALNVSPAEATWKAGVDVLCFGGTKNGIAIGEAVVFFDRELAREFDYRCKQGGQLASKMRFLSAPWTGMLKDGAWLKHARHSNAMARRLAAGLRQLPEIQVAYAVESNAVFARIPDPLAQAMFARGWKFYTHVGGWPEARLMCSWDTTAEDVDNFVADLRRFAAA
jgi:threonine aldolase